MYRQKKQKKGKKNDLFLLYTNEILKTPNSTEIALVLEKQGFCGSFRPVVSCIRQQLHREAVYAQKAAHE